MVFYPCTLIFAPNFGMGMTSRLMKSFTVAAFSIFSLLISMPSFGNGGDGENGGKKKKAFDAQEIIFGHVLDGHDFHFFDITHDDSSKTPIGIPLPVILYSPQRGFDVFMSSKFHRNCPKCCSKNSSYFSGLSVPQSSLRR